MTFDEYWQSKIDRTPELGREGKMRINTAEFRRQLEIAYRTGMAQQRIDYGDPVEEIFGSFYSKGRYG